MSFGNTFLTALRGIASNRLRAGLTTLGVIIGVASVIVMLALGNGARMAVDANFSYLGADTIQVMKRYFPEDENKLSTAKPLTYADGLAIRQDIDQVRLVDMSVTASARVRYGRNALDMGVTGTTPDGFIQVVQSATLQPVGWPEQKPVSAADFIDRGRFFNSSEVTGDVPVCALGAGTADELFEGENPIGQNVRVGRINCVVIGELVRLETVDPAQRYQANPNDVLYMPISTVVQNFFDQEPSVIMSVHVKDAAKIDTASQAVATLLHKRHAIQRDANNVYRDDFTMTTREELLGAQQEAARTFSILLAAMAAVSLLVGGIGIVNMMLVSVSERTG